MQQIWSVQLKSIGKYYCCKLITTRWTSEGGFCSFLCFPLKNCNNLRQPTTHNNHVNAILYLVNYSSIVPADISPYYNQLNPRVSIMLLIPFHKHTWEMNVILSKQKPWQKLPCLDKLRCCSTYNSWMLNIDLWTKVFHSFLKSTICLVFVKLLNSKHRVWQHLIWLTGTLLKYLVKFICKFLVKHNQTVCFKR